MKNTGLCLEKREIRNTKDIDFIIRDAFGIEHVLWPGEKKELIVFKEKKKKQ